MQKQSWKRVFGILLAVCMILTSVQIPGGIHLVRADGESSQSGLQSSFATGGLVQYYGEDFEDYEEGSEITQNSTLLGNGSVSVYSGGTSDTLKIVSDDNNHVLQQENAGTETSNLYFWWKIENAYRTSKGVLKYRFKLHEGAETTGDTINLPALKSTGGTTLNDLRIVRKSDGTYVLRANNDSQTAANNITLDPTSWHTVEVSVDIDNLKYYVWLDGTCVFDGISLSNVSGSTIGTFNMYIYRTTDATIYYDDFQLYKYVPYTGIDASVSAATIAVGGISDITTTYTTATEGLTFPCTGATFASSNTAIATVDADGKVTGVSAGTATITVTPPTASGLTGTKEVTIEVEAATPDTQEGVYYSWDLEDIAVDGLPEGFYGVGDNFNKENTTVFGVKEAADGNKYLEFTYPGVNEAGHFTQNFAYQISRKDISQCVFSYRLQVVKNSIETYLLKPVGSVTSDPSADKTLSNLKLDKNNNLLAVNNGDAIATLDTGKWYDLALVIDYEQDVYYIYLGESGGESTCIAALNAIAPADYINYMIAGIYARSDSSVLYDDIKITEYVAGTGAAFAEHASEIKVGESEQLSLVYTPTNLSCPGATFTSSDPAVARVNTTTGEVTAISEGTVTITATPVQKGLAAVTTTVTVVPGDVTVGPIYSEDFEQVTGDAATYLKDNGYTLGNADGVEFSVLEENGNRVLYINQPANKSGGFSMFYQLGTSVDKAVLKYKVKADTELGYLYLPSLTDYNGSKYIHHAYLAITKARLAEQKSEDAEITIDLYKACVPNADMERETWYDMEIVVDTILRKYDVYLNGDCVIRQSDIYSANAQTINSFRLGIYGGTVNGYYFDDIEVSGYVQGTGVAFADGTPNEIHVGHTEKFELAFTPADTSVHSAVFTSSDESIATVDAFGNVTGVKAGTVTITADPTLEGLANVTKTITVTEKVAVDSVTVDKTSVSLPAGGHTYVTVTVAPNNASFPQLTYSSSDESVATIDEWGEIVAVGAGSATITIVSDDDATKKATINVTVTAPTVTTTIYVATNGSDTGAGTEDDKVSIKRAMELVAANNDNMTGNIEVILEAGYYQQTETLAFTDAHSGTNGYSVIWKATEGAAPVIGGGLRIAGSTFTKWSENNAIYVVDVPDGTDTRQLFVDNVRAVRARSKGGLTNPTYQSAYGYTSDDVEIATWKNLDDIEMIFFRNWKMSRCSMETATVEGGKLKVIMDQPVWKDVWYGANNPEAYPPAWYENALELLDEPGEWYLDKSANKLYYMPRSWEDMSEVTVTVPVVEELITVYGSAYDKQAENISFIGITFADTTWLDPTRDEMHADHQNNHVNLAIHNIGNKLVDAAITVAKANSICFTDCTFTRLGITGLKMVDGVQNSMVVGNHFYDISGGAVNIGEPAWLNPDVANPSDKYMVMKNCDVLNNYIHNIGVEYESAAAISVGFASDMDLSNNEIFNIPYSGFHIGYGWQMGKENILRNMVIANNFMHHTSNGTVHDGGAIYTLGSTGYDSDELINTISGNYIKDQLTSTAVLYLDNGTTNWHVIGNVIDISRIKHTTSGNALRWVFTNTYAEDNLVEDNFTATQEAWSYHYDGNSMPYDYPTGEYYNEQTGNRFTNNTYCADAAWTAEALAIINASGLQTGYGDLRNGQAEVILTNLSESGVLVGIGGTFGVEVTLTDGKDNVVTGGDVQLYYEIADETLATISADGVITGKAEGQTTVRVYVISNNILDVVEGEVFVGDAISEVKLSGVGSTVTVAADSDGKELDTYIITTLDRVVDPDSVVYTVADTSVATVDANGNLVPQKAGTTTLTVKASLSGLEKTATYTVKVVEAGTVVTNNLSDIFDSINKDNWYTIAANVVSWDYVEGEKLTAHLSGKFANYKGFKIQDEMLHFKLKIDNYGNPGDWPSIVLRNQDYSIQVGASGSTGYMIGFGKSGLEVFRFNKGVAGRKAFYSPASKGFDNEYGSIDASVFSRDVEHDVQVGAINEENGVRLVLIIDGVTIFDFVDEYSDGAIAEAGYFGISSQGHTFTFTKVVEESTGGDEGGEGETPTPGTGEEGGEGTTPTPGTGEGDGGDDTPTPGTGEGDGEDDTPSTGTDEGDGEDETPTTGSGEGESESETPTTGADEEDGEDETPTTGAGEGDDESETPTTGSGEGEGEGETSAPGESEPDTGDSSDLMLWMMLMVMAMVVCTYLAAKKRKLLA